MKSIDSKEVCDVYQKILYSLIHNYNSCVLRKLQQWVAFLLIF
jgi:hypothetical protein